MPERKQNILYLHNKVLISGGEQSLLNLWENLDREQYNLFLILPAEGLFTQAARKLGIQVCLIHIPKLHIRNIFIVLKAFFQLTIFLVKNKIDLIHSYTPRNNILSAVTSKILRRRVIWHERNLIYGNEKDISARFVNWPDAVICNSQAVAERFRIKGKIPDKVRVILNGVNLERFSPSVPDEELLKKYGFENRKVVGLISNFNPRKRIEYLLEIAVKIVSKDPRVKFLIIGGLFGDENNSLFEEIKFRIDTMSLGEHVIFSGFKENVAELINLVQVGMHVTLKEACSRAILEFMAAGKPVVAINDGGNPELITDQETGFLVRTYDKDDFADRLLTLLHDQDLNHKMGLKARSRVESLFDVKRNARETEALYNELLKIRTKGR